MSVIDMIKANKESKWFSMNGKAEVTSDSNIKIYPEENKDFYIIVEESSVNQNSFKALKSKSPLDETTFEMEIKKGAFVEMHYKNLTHTFKLDPDKERNFYIDTGKEEIVFLDKKVKSDTSATSCGEKSLVNRCFAWVIVAYEGCCDSSKDPDPLYGMVGCNNEWYVEKCCD